jgi:hypothetical protein
VTAAAQRSDLMASGTQIKPAPFAPPAQRHAAKRKGRPRWLYCAKQEFSNPAPTCEQLTFYLPSFAAPSQLVGPAFAAHIHA